MRARQILRSIDRRLHPFTNRFYRVHSSPCLLTGNQKSGTTAIASLLATATDKPCTIDPTHFRKMKPGEPVANYVIRNRRFFSNELIKDPNFIFLLDDLRKVFPKGKFVFICRDPRQNLRSLLDRVRLPGNKDQLDEMDHEQLRRMGAAWMMVPKNFDLVGGENYIDIMAERWNAGCDVFLRHKDLFTLIRYEDFVADKVAEIQKLARTLHLSIVKDITPELDKQFQPAGQRRNVEVATIFGSSNLDRINLRCHERMTALGYEV